MRKTIREIIQAVEGEWIGKEEDLDRIVEGVFTDTRTTIPNSLFVPIAGAKFNGHDFVNQALEHGAIASFWGRNHPTPPQDGYPIILVDDPLKAMQRLARIYRQEIGCTVIGITGSNGKTTTKDLVSSVLKSRYRVHQTKGNYNNHIGLPLTLLSMPEDTEIAVIEMGMNHFGELEALSHIARPDIAVITNIGESHIEHLGSRSGIAAAKLEILSGMPKDGMLFYHGDEPLIEQAEAYQKYSGEKIPCGFQPGCQIRGELLADRGLDGILLKVMPDGEDYTLPIPGKHNALNALYAIAIGKALGLTSSEIRSGFTNLSMTKMRMEKIQGRNGSVLINDAYNASPTSVRAALDFFAALKGWKRKVLVLGDIGELGEYASKYHEEIGTWLNPNDFPYVFVTGEMSKHIVMGAHNKGYHQVEHIADVETLKEKLEHYLDSETVILFKASRFMQLDRLVNDLIES